MEAKLSSAKTMSAAPLATSVPVMPMAIPTSAALSEGASFTPSPVMATILPFSLRALTIWTLFWGETRAKILTVLTSSLSSSSVAASIWAPVMVWFSLVAMPNSLPIAKAVSAWSPVIIMVVMPALWRVATAGLASIRGGSIIATIPT